MINKPFPATAFKYIIYECMLPFKWAFLMCVLLVFAENGVYNALNWFFARLIESLKQGVSAQNLSSALWIIAAIAVLDIINVFLPKQVLMYRQKKFYFPLQEKIYGRALSYIFGHSVEYIINKQTGTLLAKTNQINSQQSTFSMLINGFWGRLSDIILKIVLLMTINFWLGVLFVVCAVAVVIANYYANKSSDRLSGMQSKAFSIYNGWLVDVISNIRLVKQFNRSDYEEKRLSVLLLQNIHLRAKSILVWFISYNTESCFVHFCSFGVLTFAVYLWSKSLINVGDIVFVLITLNGGFMWLMELCILYREFANNLAYIQSGLEPFAKIHEIQDTENAVDLKISKAEIEFRDVCFAYRNGEQIFKDFNLKIAAGEKIGIVGLSGNGKTTLINLLQRAYDISGGQILIDGQNIAEVTQNSLHKNIAVIAQDTNLFHRTIAENIAYGADKISIRKVKSAAKLACADRFIEKIPEKYNSVVGEKGCKLSGGEKQRIAIARAIYENRPILILDEATSSLDSEAEKTVADAINNLLGTQTVLAIAHRLSTLKQMDRIVYLEQGKIVEEGTFRELAKIKNGKFAKLWKMQKIKERK
ncbi:MAG: ABC transporter ATP-binding protein [Alphaproteobacteria bacterium]|nr:ABC transporter ATP-binding protein [Alphaproteobacteria bacterium]